MQKKLYSPLFARLYISAPNPEAQVIANRRPDGDPQVVCISFQQLNCQIAPPGIQSLADHKSQLFWVKY